MNYDEFDTPVIFQCQDLTAQALPKHILIENRMAILSNDCFILLLLQENSSVAKGNLCAAGEMCFHTSKQFSHDQADQSQLFLFFPLLFLSHHRPYVM